MKFVKQKLSKLGYPKATEGFDGELSLNITNNGIGLFGKVKNTWYQFGSGKQVGNKGLPDNKRNRFLRENLNILDINVDRTVNIGKTAITTNPNRIFSNSAADTDYLYISSKVFDVESSSTASKLYIGDISLQPTWGSTGSSIQLESGGGHGSDLTIGGAGAGALNKDGGIPVQDSKGRAPIGGYIVPPIHTTLGSVGAVGAGINLADADPYTQGTTQLFPLGTELHQGENAYRYVFMNGAVAAVN